MSGETIKYGESLLTERGSIRAKRGILMDVWSCVENNKVLDEETEVGWLPVQSGLVQRLHYRVDRDVIQPASCPSPALTPQIS